MGVKKECELWNNIDVRDSQQATAIKELLGHTLKGVLDKGYDLGGMGEYGRGWNDRGVQIKEIVNDIIKRWENGENQT